MLLAIDNADEVDAAARCVGHRVRRRTGLGRVDRPPRGVKHLDGGLWREARDLEFILSGIGIERGLGGAAVQTRDIGGAASVDPRDAGEVPIGFEGQTHVVQGRGCHIDNARRVAVVKCDDALGLVPLCALHRAIEAAACTVANFQSITFGEGPMPLQG